VLIGALIPAIAPGINTPNTQTFSHSLTFGLNLAVLSNMLQFMYNKRSRKKKDGHTHLSLWGPCYLLFSAIWLIMADLTRHLVNDSWKYQNCDDFDNNNGQVRQVCEVHGVWNEYLPTGGLSIYGIVFTVLCTWAGFILMAWGIGWGLDLHLKIRNAYTVGRNVNRSGRSPTSNSNSPGRINTGGTPLLQQLPVESSCMSLDDMIRSAPLVYIGKAWCPFCAKAKAAIARAGVTPGNPAFKQYELEDEYRKPLVDNGPLIQDDLQSKYGSRSVPKIFLNGELLGGGDDMVAQEADGSLKKKFRDARIIQPY